MVEYGMPAETPPASVQHNDSGHPRAVLLCRPNSHPFTDRNLVLDHEVKVGRSVARAKPGPNNAIFDCKVLSRNHAVLWYSQGKFYLQDTKSSNGTFVNNQRLSKGTEESAPREVCSGDILQFGVDVMENSRQVTHGCIIATLKLYLPDGKEAKASPSIVNSTSGACVPPQDLYQLNTFIQESIAREQLLENKLLALQSIITDTEMSSKSSWKALMEEDRLLTRVEILENQLGTYSKSMSEDKLREETKRLMEDKEKYQIAAKDSLKKLVDEKLEMVRKLQDTETKFSSLQQEYNSIHSLYNGVLQENNKLSIKISDLTDELTKVQKEEEEGEEEVEEKGEMDNTKEIIIENRLADLEVYVQNGESPLINGKGKGDTEGGEEDELLNSTQTLLLTSNSESEVEVRNDNETVEENIKDISDQDIRCRVKELEHELQDTRELLTESRNDNSVMMQDMNNLKNKLDNAERLIESQDLLVKEMEIRCRIKEVPQMSEENQISSTSLTQLSGDETSKSPQTEGSSESPTPQNSVDTDTFPQDDAVSVSSDVSESSLSSISEGSSQLISDYSEATLKRSPSSSSTSMTSMSFSTCPTCSSADGKKSSLPEPDQPDQEVARREEILEQQNKLETQMNSRICELEQENFQLRQKLLELQHDSPALKVCETQRGSGEEDLTSLPEVNATAAEVDNTGDQPSVEDEPCEDTKENQQPLEGVQEKEKSPEKKEEEGSPENVEKEKSPEKFEDKEEVESVASQLSDSGKGVDEKGEEVVDAVQAADQQQDDQQPNDHVQNSTGKDEDTSEQVEDGGDKTDQSVKDKEKKDDAGRLLEDKLEILQEIPAVSEAPGAEINQNISAKVSSDTEKMAGEIPSEVTSSSLPETVRPDVESLLNMSCSGCTEISAVESALTQAEVKIAQLLKLRENLIQVQAENLELEQSVSDLEEDIEALGVTSRYLTVFNMIPVLVLLIAIFIAFLPSLSSLMGTRDL